MIYEPTTDNIITAMQLEIETLEDKLEAAERLNKVMGLEIKDAHQTIYEYEEEKDIDGKTLASVCHERNKAEQTIAAISELPEKWACLDCSCSPRDAITPDKCGDELQALLKEQGGLPHPRAMLSRVVPITGFTEENDMTEPTTAEIRKRHYAETNDYINPDYDFGDAPQSHKDRGILLDRLERTEKALIGLRKDYDLNNCRANEAEATIAAISAKVDSINPVNVSGEPSYHPVSEQIWKLKAELTALLKEQG